MRRFIYDKDLKKVVEISTDYIPYSGVTIIPDEKEFVSHNAFPETVKWTGRRSKKELMKKYNCVDAREIKGLGKEKLARIQKMRDGYAKDPMIQTSMRSLKTPQEIRQRKQEVRKYFFSNYKVKKDGSVKYGHQ